MTNQYDDKFKYLIFVYIIFDLYIIAKMFVKFYLQSKPDLAEKVKQINEYGNYLLGTSVICGVIILLMILLIRL